MLGQRLNRPVGIVVPAGGSRGLSTAARLVEARYGNVFMWRLTGAPIRIGPGFTDHPDPSPTRLFIRPRTSAVMVHDSVMGHVVAPQEIAIFDATQIVELVTTAGGCDFVLLAMDQLRADRYFRTAFILPARLAITSALDDLLQDAFDGDTIAKSSELSAGIHLLSQLSQDTQSRKAAMLAFARDHAISSRLSVKTLCRKFTVSRATVFRAFESVGGVNAFVQRQRLNTAILKLWSENHARGSVKRIARECGFDDQFHFSRLCRRVMGVTPSDVLSMRCST